MATSSHRHRRDPLGAAALALAVVLLALAPLYRGGNRPLALLALECVALAGLALALLPSAARQRIPLGAWLLAGLLIAVPLVQLIPVPVAAWGALPGRAPFVTTLVDVAGATSHAISVVPFETEYAALALLPVLAMLFLGAQLRTSQVRTATQVLVAVAAVQAVAGLMQYGMLGGGAASARASGTFVNPNHFAGLLLMVLPIALMGLAVEIGDRTRERVRGRGMIGVFKRAVASKGLKVLAAAVVAVLILVAIVYSRSRAGIALAAIGVALTTLAAAPRVGGPRAYGVIGLVLAIAVGVALAIGLIPVVDRFAETDMLDDDRWPMIMGAIGMAGQFFPMGSGTGTFAALYPPFQPAGILAFVHRAHNEYVEWIVEGGLLALVAILFAVALYAIRVVLLARATERHRVHYLQVGAALGVLLMALHSLVDFNLRIPANAMVFAFLSGVLLARHSATAERSGRRAHLPTGAVPVAPLPELDPDAAARVRAVWTGAPAAAALPPAPPPAPRPVPTLAPVTAGAVARTQKEPTP